MEEKKPNLNLENLINVLQIKIWKHCVDVYTDDFSLIPYIEKIKKNAETYGIPAFNIIEQKNAADCNMLVLGGRKSEINWLPKENTMIISVEPKHLETIDKEVAYKSLSLTERMRQLEGVLVSNGAGVVNPDERGVLLFGKRAHGKTNISLTLCRDYGYSFMASDQVIFGFNYEKKHDLWLFEGTKDVTLRRVAVEKYFPEYLNLFPKGKFWDDKVYIQEKELKIKFAKRPALIKAAFLVNLDYYEDVPFTIKNVKDDLETSLFLAEIMSRHITAVCSPLLDENNNFLNLCPSFDDAKIREIRQKIIKKVIRIPMYKILGGKIIELTDCINGIVSGERYGE